jgi:hypothetical protein
VAEHTSWVLSWTTKVDEEEGKEKQSKARITYYNAAAPDVWEVL